MKITIATLHVRRSPQAVPLAAGCIAAALPQELRRQCRLINLFPEMSDAEMLQAITEQNPDMVAFPLYVWNRQKIFELSRRLKKDSPRITLTAGGPEASADADNCMEEGQFDSIVQGEGELTFRLMVEALCSGKPLNGINGLVWRQGGTITHEKKRTPVASFDDLPSPWLTGVLRPEREGGLLWETARGCHFACDFCFDSRGQQGVRPLSSKRLREELLLFSKAKTAQIWVLDSTFNFPPERARELLQLISRQKQPAHFHLEAKADFLDRNLARLLAHIPCSVQIGLQSARPQVLKNVHRPMDWEQFSQKLRLLAAEGVTFGLDLIYGLPGDNHDGFRHSLNQALSFAPNHVDIFPLAVLPGTQIFRNRDRFALRSQSCPPYEVEECATYSRKDMSKSRLLAAAADLFYNRGRAVGFFPALLTATGDGAADFLEEFARWALEDKKIPRKRFLAAEQWCAADILPLQEEFIRFALKRKEKAPLVAAALDLLHYHFHYAETLLGEETLTASTNPRSAKALWRTALVRSKTIRLVPFSYEVLELLDMGNPQLDTISERFRPVGSVALFLKRGGEVICESLEEDFLKLLENSDGKHTPKQIFGGSLPEDEGQEIVQFAVEEGLLV